MRSVARAEPSVVVTRVGDGHAPEVGAHAHEHHPLRIRRSVDVSLRISKRSHVNRDFLLNLTLRPATDEHRLTAPLDGDRLANLDLGEVHFQGRQREDVGGGAHGQKKLEHRESKRGGVDDATAGEDHVGERPFGGVTGLVHRVVALIVPETGR